MTVAATVSLTDLHNDISGTDGPFIREDGRQVARIWLRNGYGASVLEEGPDAWEVLVIREIADNRPHWGGETPWIADYSTPATPARDAWDKSPTLHGQTVDQVESVLRVLSELPDNDPRDMRARYAV
ncbi:hypothetical protein IEJ02_10720 [Streptomyces sp. 5-10]|nr:hypothetical protein [Streptomyces sp. 5-10]